MKKLEHISRKKKLTAGILILIIGIGIIFVCYFFSKKISSQDNKESSELKNEQERVSENTYTAEGTTEASVVNQQVKFNVKEVDVAVEKVYVQNGDKVETGTPLYKLTDESVSALKEYYEEEIAEAQDTLTTANSNYETGILEAEYSKDSKSTEAEMAEEVYSTSLEELENQVTSKQNNYNSAVAQINSYANNLNNDTYYTEYGVEKAKNEEAEAQKAYEDSEKSYKTEQENYETVWKKVAEDIENLKKSSEKNESTDISDLIDTLNYDYLSLETSKKTMEDEEKKIEQAKAESEKKKNVSEQVQNQYQQAVNEAQQQKGQLEENLSKLSQEYDDAVQQLAVKKASLKNDYEKTVLNGDYAQTTYENCVNTLQTAVEDATKELEDLQEQQTELLEIKDGIICASQTGTISKVNYKVQDILVSGQALVSYYDNNSISISVEVSQDYIAQIKVGDNVNVVVSGSKQGSVEGTVNEVETSATTGAGISSVTYTVIILVDNSEGNISTETSTNVQFNIESKNGGK